MSFGKDSSRVFIMQDGVLTEVGRLDNSAARAPLDPLEEEVYRIFGEYKELQAELAEARKKPKSGEFTKTQRAAVQMCIDAYETEDWMSAGSVGIQRLLDACDIIDRLTAENAVIKNAQIAELAKVGTDEEVIAYLHDDRYYHTKEEKRAATIIDRLTAELKDKDEKIGRQAETILRFDNYCRVNDIDLEQILKGES